MTAPQSQLSPYLEQLRELRVLPDRNGLSYSWALGTVPFWEEISTNIIARPWSGLFASDRRLDVNISGAALVEAAAA